MKNAIVLVSHHQKVGEGLAEMINHMVPDENDSFEIFSASGTANGALGTNPIRVLEVLEPLSDFDNIYVLYDMGSAKMSTELARDYADPDLQEKIVILRAPLVEGAYILAVECSIGHNREEVLAELSLMYDQKDPHG